MTQLIAASCNNGNELIIISDRMVSASDFSLTFEHDAKIDRLSNCICALSTGTIHETEIVSDTCKEITDRMSVRQVAEIVAQNYRNTRQKHIETVILSKYGLASFDDLECTPMIGQKGLGWVGGVPPYSVVPVPALHTSPATCSRVMNEDA